MSEEKERGETMTWEEEYARQMAGTGLTGQACLAKCDEIFKKLTEWNLQHIVTQNINVARELVRRVTEYPRLTRKADLCGRMVKVIEGLLRIVPQEHSGSCPGDEFCSCSTISLISEAESCLAEFDREEKK
jgi:hypothetical protein